MDEPIRFRCHKCENFNSCSMDKFGTEIICDKCKGKIVVPSRIDSISKAFETLAAATFSPRSYVDVFYAVPIAQLRKLIVAFDFKKENMDYFYYGSKEIQVEGTNSLIVTNDRTGHLPMSEGMSVLGERYLKDKLYFIRANDNGIYSLGYDHGGGLLGPLLIEQLYISVARRVFSERFVYDRSE